MRRGFCTLVLFIIIIIVYIKYIIMIMHFMQVVVQWVKRKTRKVEYQNDSKLCFMYSEVTNIAHSTHSGQRSSEAFMHEMD